MTTTRIIVVAAGALALASVGPAGAVSDYERADRIAPLERRADSLEARALSTKGGPQQELLMRRALLQQLIDRLDAGEYVDPHEIDELLSRTPRS